MEAPKLSQRLFFLEAARTLAALYVFIYHVLQRIPPVNSFVKISFSFGQEAVMLFFVLSGFVIYYSQRLKGSDVQTKRYLIARFTRIYPVFIFALFVSYISVCFIDNKIVSPDFTNFVSNLFMLQDFSTGKPGVWIVAYMGNSPLWSLSYEWWFYMLFLPVMLVKSNKQIHIVAIVSILSLIVYLAMPNQLCLWLIYFIIWWAGVEASKKYVGENTGKNNFVLIYLLAIISILALYSFFVYGKSFEFGIFPILFLRHFIMALLFYFFLIKVDVSTFKITEKNILVKLAPYSYAFYVLHYPLLNIFNDTGLLLTSGWNIVFLFLIVMVLTWFAEDVIHRNVSKWIRGLF